MIHYRLILHSELVKQLKERRQTIHMASEGRVILNILTSDSTKRSYLQKYTLDVPEKTIEFVLAEELDKKLYDSLAVFWDIEVKEEVSPSES